MDLQKVSATADSCVFSGLRAGSLYRLQVVSWSRGMSSDSSVLARTGQSVTHAVTSGSTFFMDCSISHPLYRSFHSSFDHMNRLFTYCICFFSSVPSTVSSLEVQSSGRTDRLTVSWQPGGGSWSSYQVTIHLTYFTSLPSSSVAPTVTVTLVVGRWFCTMFPEPLWQLRR